MEENCVEWAKAPPCSPHDCRSQWRRDTAWSRAVGDEHAAIVTAVLNADVEGAVALLTAHDQRTADVILQDETIFPELKAKGAEK
nr:FCD domain-containing protein [Bradyrhizobium sp. ORS 375]